MVTKKIDDARLESLGHEFENCYNDLATKRTNLQSEIETLPYHSESAAPRFRRAMNEWDLHFDRCCSHLKAMRDLLLDVTKQNQLNESNNLDQADFFTGGLDDVPATTSA